MTPEVAVAIREIAEAFPVAVLDSAEDEQGGALVMVPDLPLNGDVYQQSTSWIGFHITHTYPYADIYPHFARHDLARRDGKPLGVGTSIGQFRGKSAVQISRKANRHDPATDTALLKLCKVLRWLNSLS